MVKGDPELNQEKEQPATLSELGALALGGEIAGAGLGFVDGQWVANKLKVLIETEGVDRNLVMRLWNALGRIHADHLLGRVVAPGVWQQYFVFLFEGGLLNLDNLESVMAYEPLSLRHKNFGPRLDDTAQYLIDSRYEEMGQPLSENP